MNKNSLMSVIFVTVGAVAALCVYFIHRVKVETILSNERVQLKTERESREETRDRFTVCVDTVMARSIEAKQPITANEAKDICLHSEKF